MKIRNVTIRNFRGIKELGWPLPDRSLFCLIGKGDSSKSTLLEAIRYVFYPNWNLSFDDSDFYQADTSNPIIIEVTVGELPDEFCPIDRYGRCLRGWDKTEFQLIDEPDDGLEEVLTVRLSVTRDLEPKWNIICDRVAPDEVPFKTSDRVKACVSLIGIYTDRQLTWGKGTVLSHLTDSENITSLLADAARSTRGVLDNQRESNLANFDNAAKDAEVIAKELGVPVSASYKSQLDISAINLNVGGLALHDGDIPLRQMGLGSRRMLLCGLQKKALSKCHITLFDEIELGLEPHRITRLIKHIKSDHDGQYFLTTHSPTVLRELTIDDLFIMHNNEGCVQILSASAINKSKLNIQGNIRAGAEAFLANKVIICEGQTEVGILRGFDDFWSQNGLNTFAFQSVAILNATGATKVKDLAIGLKSLLYDVVVVVDSDAQDNFSYQNAEELKALGVEVVIWADKTATEERVFLDIPWDYVQKSLVFAKEELGKPVIDQVRSHLNIVQPELFNDWQESIELRHAIGKAAKSKDDWFKDISRSEEWGKLIAPVLNATSVKDKDFIKQIYNLRKWVDGE